MKSVTPLTARAVVVAVVGLFVLSTVGGAATYAFLFDTERANATATVVGDGASFPRGEFVATTPEDETAGGKGGGPSAFPVASRSTPPDPGNESTSGAANATEDEPPVGDASTPEPTPELTPESVPESTPAPTPESTPESTPEPTSESTPESTPTDGSVSDASDSTTDTGDASAANGT